MSFNIIERIAKLFREKRSIGKISGARKVGVIFIILFPLLFAIIYSYVKLFNQLTQAAYDRRETIAYLASQALEEKLNGLAAVGRELASRPVFREMIVNEKWNDAIQRIKSVPQDFPEIDRIFLTDLKGILMADFPSVPTLEKANLSSQDWYKGISHKWKPYLSGIYAESRAPHSNALAMAVPVHSSKNERIAILVLQLSVHKLLSSMKLINIGPGGFVYVVDQYGYLVFHPKFYPEKELVDFTASPSVQEAIKGNRGVKIFYNPIEKESRVSAYEPLYKYGWAVVAQQPTATVFASRNRTMRIISTVYWLVIMIGSALAYFVILALEVIDTHRRELQQALEQVKVLKGMIPICAECKKIRDDKGYWQQVEIYVHEHTEAEFTHGVCPECVKKLYPKQFDELYPDAS